VTWRTYYRDMSSMKRISALAAAHEHFLATPAVPVPDLIRPVVADSWRRSLALGADPLAEAAPLDLAEPDLAEYRANHPLAAMMPLIRQLLTEDADEAGHIVAVGDALGRLLWVEGHHRLRTRAEQMHFVEGSLWSEQASGTNAPGTALALGRAVGISADEHFGLGARSWSCVAAPVHDPRSGELIGVIDLTGGPDVSGPRVLALVRACAAAVEAGLQLRAGPVGRHVPQARSDADVRCADGGAQHRGARLRLLGPEAGSLEVAGRTIRLSRRHTELVWLLACAPAGLSAQALDVALHPEGEHLITVRAEINRLRRVLGPSMLSSRPYRLEVEVGTDVAEVRTLLAQGQVQRALDLYTTGPLPGSDAPGIRSMTDEFVCEVRQAVLACAAAGVLERWAALPEGSDDAEVWQALVDALPAGSPRQALALARLARLG